ncbi:MAG: hypothetical protein BAJALOKI1v1_1060003 [Promethearchaeota archaeon]|nr:MAG: hypothetical protein BAJALOKI1v1_1060003 [Candidatus Lokiarchaeota archaeon]
MITGVYILEKDNSPFLSYINQYKKREYQDNITRLTESLSMLAKDINDKLSFFVLGPKKYFYTIDTITQTKFIVETEKDMKDKKVDNIIREIKNYYINEFMARSIMSVESLAEAKIKMKKKILTLIDTKNLTFENSLSKL